ncbi:MAG TPA: PLP-dependent transferase [Thermomicrobiales bacterium]|nr:PLP-dependent transferase [Thermomicrobiales bacterium]
MLPHLGAPLSPFSAWLLLRRIKTLELRMKRHSSNALSLAAFLSAYTAVTLVYYPGLSSHPDHDITPRLMGGQYG